MGEGEQKPDVLAGIKAEEIDRTMMGLRDFLLDLFCLGLRWGGEHDRQLESCKAEGHQQGSLGPKGVQQQTEKTSELWLGRKLDKGMDLSLEMNGECGHICTMTHS